MLLYKIRYTSYGIGRSEKTKTVKSKNWPATAKVISAQRLGIIGIGLTCFPAPLEKPWGTSAEERGIIANFNK